MPSVLGCQDQECGGRLGALRTFVAAALRAADAIGEVTLRAAGAIGEVTLRAAGALGEVTLRAAGALLRCQEYQLAVAVEGRP
jgi:hypothetical protein